MFYLKNVLFGQTNSMRIFKSSIFSKKFCKSKKKKKRFLQTMEKSPKTKGKPSTVADFFLEQSKASFNNALDAILQDLNQISKGQINPATFSRTIINRISSILQSERESFISYILTCFGKNEIPNDIFQLIQKKAQANTNIDPKGRIRAELLKYANNPKTLSNIPTSKLISNFYSECLTQNKKLEELHTLTNDLIGQTKANFEKLKKITLKVMTKQAQNLQKFTYQDTYQTDRFKSENELLKQSYRTLEAENMKLKRQLHQYETQADSPMLMNNDPSMKYRNENQSLKEENSRLSQMVRNMNAVTNEKNETELEKEATSQQLKITLDRLDAIDEERQRLFKINQQLLKKLQHYETNDFSATQVLNKLHSKMVNTKETNETLGQRVSEQDELISQLELQTQTQQNQIAAYEKYKKSQIVETKRLEQEVVDLETELKTEKEINKNLQKEIQDLQVQLQAQTESVSRFAERENTLISRLDESRKSASILEDSLQKEREVSKNYNDLSEKIEQKNQEILQLKEKLRQMKEIMNSLERKNERKKEQMKTLVSHLQEQQEVESEKSLTEEDYKQQLLQKEHENALLTQELEDSKKTYTSYKEMVKKEIFSLNQQRNEVERQYLKFKMDTQNTINSSESIQRICKEQQQTINVLRSDFTSVRKQLLDSQQELKNKTSSLEQEKQNLRLQVQQLSNTNAELRQNLLQAEINRKRSEEILKTSIKQYEQDVSNLASKIESNRNSYREQVQSLLIENQALKDIHSDTQAMIQKSNVVMDDKVSNYANQITNLQSFVDKASLLVLGKKEENTQVLLQEIMSITQQLKQKDTSISQLKEALKTMSKEFNDAVTSKETLETQLTDTKTALQQITNENEQKAQKIEDFAQQLEKEKNHSLTLEDELHNLSDLYNNLEHNHSLQAEEKNKIMGSLQEFQQYSTNLEQCIESLKQELQTSQENTSNQENQNVSISTENELLNRKNSQLHNLLIQTSEEKDQMAKEIVDLKVKCSQIEQSFTNHIESMSKEIDQVNLTNLSLNEDNERLINHNKLLQERCNSLSQSLHEMQSNFNSAESSPRKDKSSQDSFESIPSPKKSPVFMQQTNTFSRKPKPLSMQEINKKQDGVNSLPQALSGSDLSANLIKEILNNSNSPNIIIFNGQQPLSPIHSNSNSGLSSPHRKYDEEEATTEVESNSSSSPSKSKTYSQKSRSSKKSSNSSQISANQTTKKQTKPQRLSKTNSSTEKIETRKEKSQNQLSENTPNNSNKQNISNNSPDNLSASMEDSELQNNSISPIKAEYSASFQEKIGSNSEVSNETNKEASESENNQQNANQNNMQKSSENSQLASNASKEKTNQSSKAYYSYQYEEDYDQNSISEQNISYNNQEEEEEFDEEEYQNKLSKEMLSTNSFIFKETSDNYAKSSAIINTNKLNTGNKHSQHFYSEEGNRTKRMVIESNSPLVQNTNDSEIQSSDLEKEEGNASYISQDVNDYNTSGVLEQSDDMTTEENNKSPSSLKNQSKISQSTEILHKPTLNNNIDVDKSYYSDAHKKTPRNSPIIPPSNNQQIQEQQQQQIPYPENYESESSSTIQQHELQQAKKSPKSRRNIQNTSKSSELFGASQISDSLPQVQPFYSEEGQRTQNISSKTNLNNKSSSKLKSPSKSSIKSSEHLSNNQRSSISKQSSTTTSKENLKQSQIKSPLKQSKQQLTAQSTELLNTSKLGQDIKVTQSFYSEVGNKTPTKSPSKRSKQNVSQQSQEQPVNQTEEHTTPTKIRKNQLPTKSTELLNVPKLDSEIKLAQSYYSEEGNKTPTKTPKRSPSKSSSKQNPSQDQLENTQNSSTEELQQQNQANIPISPQSKITNIKSTEIFSPVKLDQDLQIQQGYYSEEGNKTPTKSPTKRSKQSQEKPTEQTTKEQPKHTPTKRRNQQLPTKSTELFNVPKLDGDVKFSQIYYSEEGNKTPTKSPSKRSKQNISQQQTTKEQQQQQTSPKLRKQHLPTKSTEQLNVPKLEGNINYAQAYYSEEGNKTPTKSPVKRTKQNTSQSTQNQQQETSPKIRKQQLPTKSTELLNLPKLDDDIKVTQPFYSEEGNKTPTKSPKRSPSKSSSKQNPSQDQLENTQNSTTEQLQQQNKENIPVSPQSKISNIKSTEIFNSVKLDQDLQIQQSYYSEEGNKTPTKSPAKRSKQNISKSLIQKQQTNQSEAQSTPTPTKRKNQQLPTKSTELFNVPKLDGDVKFSQIYYSEEGSKTPTKSPSKRSKQNASQQSQEQPTKEQQQQQTSPKLRKQHLPTKSTEQLKVPKLEGDLNYAQAYYSEEGNKTPTKSPTKRSKQNISQIKQNQSSEQTTTQQSQQTPTKIRKNQLPTKSTELLNVPKLDGDINLAQAYYSEEGSKTPTKSPKRTPSKSSLKQNPSPTQQENSNQQLQKSTNQSSTEELQQQTKENIPISPQPKISNIKSTEIFNPIKLDSNLEIQQAYYSEEGNKTPTKANRKTPKRKQQNNSSLIENATNNQSNTSENIPIATNQTPTKSPIKKQQIPTKSTEVFNLPEIEGIVNLQQPFNSEEGNKTPNRSRKSTPKSSPAKKPSKTDSQYIQQSESDKEIENHSNVSQNSNLKSPKSLNKQGKFAQSTEVLYPETLSNNIEANQSYYSDAYQQTPKKSPNRKKQIRKPTKQNQSQEEEANKELLNNLSQEVQNQSTESHPTQISLEEDEEGFNSQNQSKHELENEYSQESVGNTANQNVSNIEEEESAENEAESQPEEENEYSQESNGNDINQNENEADSQPEEENAEEEGFEEEYQNESSQHESDPQKHFLSTIRASQNESKEVVNPGENESLLEEEEEEEEDAHEQVSYESNDENSPQKHFLSTIRVGDQNVSNEMTPMHNESHENYIEEEEEEENQNQNLQEEEEEEEEAYQENSP